MPEVMAISGHKTPTMLFATRMPTLKKFEKIAKPGR